MSSALVTLLGLCGGALNEILHERFVQIRPAEDGKLHYAKLGRVQLMSSFSL